MGRTGSNGVGSAGVGRVVLVTGLSRELAASTARRYAERDDVEKVVGVDVQPPKGELEGVKFVRADIRTPVVAKIIAVEEVDTVVHLDLGPNVRGRGSVKELNVIGAMQLLAACQQAETVKRLIVFSSAAVYGTSARNPAMFTERSEPRGPRSGFSKDVSEVEGYVRGFARRREDVSILIFRAVSMLDRRVETSFGPYLSNPVLPAALGFDPRLQFLHLDDARAVLQHALSSGVSGTFNVSGGGVVLLTQLARRLGRPLLPLPPVGFGDATRRVLKLTGSQISPDLHRLLTFGRVIDTTALRDEFGYVPAFSTEDVVAEYAHHSRGGVLSGLTGEPR